MGETRRLLADNRAVPERDEHFADLFDAYSVGRIFVGSRRVTPDAIKFVAFSDKTDKISKFKQTLS